MDKKRPTGRQKHVTEGGSGVHRRGDGTGSGPVGSGGRKGGSSGGSGGGGKRAAAGGGGLVVILVLIFTLLKGGGLSDMMSSGTSATQSGTLYTNLSGDNGWTDEDGNNTGKLNTEVDESAREKYTVLTGDGKDTVTIMVYMCGTDLESRSGMATSDLTEMTKATLSSNVNVLVYTGGCKKWNNNIVSSSKNQIYLVKDGGVKCLEKDMGTSAMTDPNNLSTFIKWCAKNYPATRNDLILWDHGGGSISGYGYDEKNTKSGSMTLSKIKAALEKGGVQFDFIGFDACLMATAETAQMLTPYADYLIASEETEPGIGWYYTDWLTNLSKDTSMETIQIGKNIADDFVSTCASKAKGQTATLSVVDLAELQSTLPAALSGFSKSTTELIKNESYATVSNARSESREFATSSKIDQIDLVHFADKLGTDEAKELRDVLLGAIKYNKTSSDMTNAYGLSVYFPSKRVSSVDSMVNTYEEIGLDTEYSKCIQSYASVEVSGQAASGGTTSPYSTIFGSGTSSSANGNAEMVEQLLSAFLGGDFSSVSGLTDKNVNFLDEGIDENTESYIAEHQLDTTQLMWSENDEGQTVLVLSEEQWEMIQMLELSMFYDDGEGYVDLGLDNVFDFDDDGNLIGENDHTWLAINGQVVAYYFDEQTVEGDSTTIRGHVPALLNGERVNLQIVFNDENPNGAILGAKAVYESETDPVAKGLIELKEGDTLDFLCDFYSYEGDYQDSYYLGEQMTVSDTMEISNVDVGDGDVSCAYRLTDIYNQYYWTPAMP